MRRAAASRRARGPVVAAALLHATAAAIAGEAPGRVMSLNVCTDQLAMLVARPGQLVSVSELARDPSLSPLHAEAADLPTNRGLAEEVFAAAPDLVVTGTYSLHNTTQLLERLGIEVETFEYAQTLDTIAGELRRMGALLGNAARADALAREFETAMAGMATHACARRPTALAYEQNGIVLGEGTLVDSVIRAAGLTNLATTHGFAGMTPFPLELLVDSRPDILILPEPMSDAPSLADQIGLHPAIRALSRTVTTMTLPQGTTACGSPFVVGAVRALAAARDRLPACATEPRG